MPNKVFSLLLLISLIPRVEAQSTGMFKTQSYKHASVGVYVFDEKALKVKTDINAQQSLEPASVVKLVTTAVALETFGPDHRFKTNIEYSGKIEEGILRGDLLIRGGGDPSLGSRQTGKDPEAFIKEWVDAVKKAGIREVDGCVLADAGIFDEEPISPYWLWEDLGNYYAPGIFGLAVFDNSYQLDLKSGVAGSKPEVLGVRPALPMLKIENHLVAVDNNLDSAYLYGAPYQWQRQLFGTMPSNRERFTIRGDMPDPPLFLAGYFSDALQANGVKISGNASSDRELDLKVQPIQKGHILCTTYSIPLAQMLRIIHEKSDNLYTEYLLRHLSLTRSDKPASVRVGLQVVRDFWKKQGLDCSALALSDACGLSPNDRISAEFLAQVLHYMSRNSRYSSVYKAAFPLAGKEGSVSSFLKGTILEGKLRLKSGSVQAVTSYAGYYEQNGKSYIVVLIVNYANAIRSQIRKDMEDFLLSL